MVTKDKGSNASFVLGILSICLFWLTWPATILAIIGLCVSKRKENKRTDITLNIIGLIGSLSWSIFILVMMLAAGGY